MRVYCAHSSVVERVVDIDEVPSSILGARTNQRAYGEVVSHIHGMDGFGVRLPVGPQKIFVVPGVGFEPTRTFVHDILSVARLPFRHPDFFYISPPMCWL